MSVVYTVKVEDSRPATDQKPSAGPVYRSIYAKDGLLDLPAGLESPWQFFSDSAKKSPSNPMLGRRQVTDSKEVYDVVVCVGSAMRSRGVTPGNRCGIYGSNCSEWIMAMEACNSQAVTYVPLYDTLGANAVEFIINHAEVSIAFVQENKIPAVAIVSFSNISSTQKKEAEELGVSCFSWKEFSELGSSNDELPPKQKTDICTIMYTSGTTGEPKGVILTNAAIMAEDIRFLMDDIQELKPSMFCGVPRVYDRIYAGIVNKVSSGGALRKALFQYAYNYKLGNLEKGLPQDKAAPFLDRLVFDKIKQGLGGRIRIMLSGAAPLPGHVEEFLRVTSCSTLSQGYGNVFPMMGTVGVPITTIEARLESVPEMGYDALSSTPRGEICLRGKTLFSGYHKRQDLTEDVLVDGWFHTGDIGEWQPNGAMKIIDRKKNIFKLSQGEYVAVENIESTYLRCPLLTSIWVYGNSFESFLVAVVVPDRKALEDWAINHNVTGDFNSLCENLKARKYILDELNDTGHKNQLRGFELLKAVHLEPNPFDMERDLITPTFKLKRPQLLKYYKDTVDQLYSEAKGIRG
uniref:AMP-dependent synthetase/ligase domain-containing protein n=1 Tax=Fagus sylvatica TaxID=28930 RepID=A0A2N9FY86_FAGSY